MRVRFICEFAVSIVVSIVVSIMCLSSVYRASIDNLAHACELKRTGSAHGSWSGERRTKPIYQATREDASVHAKRATRRIHGELARMG